jgi:hypothetical protein
MDRALRIAELVLPLVLAGAAAVMTGEPGVAMALAALAAALLGWSLVLTVRGVLTMAGALSAGGDLARRVRQLERDRLALLRAVKEIELDVALLRLSPEEAQALRESFDGQAARVQRELDEVRQQGGPVAAAIDREIERRLGRAETGEEGAG